MSKRLHAFDSYKSHAWLKKVYAKLSAEEIKIARAFIATYDQLPRGDFEHAINRMFLGVENKPRNWPAIAELLTCCNSASEGQAMENVHDKIARRRSS